jgi:hypothetical protein
MATGPISQNGYFRNHILECEGLASELGTGTTATSAVTINDYAGLITTEALTTAQNSKETITLTNDKIAATSLVFVSIGNGTNTQGTPVVQTVTAGAGTCEIIIANKHATAESLNGTLKVAFFVVKAL